MNAVNVQDLPLTGLPGSAYTDPTWLAREEAMIFRPRWLYGCHLSQLAEPGAFVRWDRGANSLLLVRGDDGEVRALHNVCRHRGARLEERESGTCPAIVCPYHGWSYRRDGSLRATPRMHEEFDPSDLNLKQAWTEVWNGFVFLSLGDERPAPLAEQLAGVEFESYDLEATKVVAEREVVVAANWKICWENGLECYHCALNHPELKEVVDIMVRDDPSQLDPEWVFVPDMAILGSAKSVTKDGALQNQQLLGAPGSPPRDVAFFAWHTTLTEIVAAPDHAHLMLYRPIDPGHTAIRLVAMVHRDAEEGKDFDPEGLFELHRVTRGQDNALCERVQAGVESPAFVPGPFNQDYELSLQAFLRTYSRAMGER